MQAFAIAAGITLGFTFVVFLFASGGILLFIGICVLAGVGLGWILGQKALRLDMQEDREFQEQSRFRDYRVIAEIVKMSARGENVDFSTIDVTPKRLTRSKAPIRPYE